MLLPEVLSPRRLAAAATGPGLAVALALPATAPARSLATAQSICPDGWNLHQAGCGEVASSGTRRTGWVPSC